MWRLRAILRGKVPAMPQRLNDVTGEPIRLSARQREAQREELVTVVNQLIVAMNNAGNIVQHHEQRLEAHEAALQVLVDRFETWQHGTFRQRLRWLFLGMPDA